MEDNNLLSIIVIVKIKVNNKGWINNELIKKILLSNFNHQDAQSISSIS